MNGDVTVRQARQGAAPRPSAAAAPSRGRRWWLIYLIVGSGAVAVGPLLPEAGQQSLYTLLGLGAIGAVVLGLRMHRPARPLAWQLLLVTMTVVVLANGAWAVQAALGVPDVGVSVVDLVYLSMYPLLAACLAILPVHGRYGSPLAGMAEAGIATSAAAVLSWTLLVDPLVYDVGVVPAHAEVVAYPVLDLIILAMAVRMAFVTGTRAPAHLLIILTSVCLLAADTAYFVATTGGGGPQGPAFSVAGWLMANLLMGAAALHPSMAAVAPVQSAGRRSARPVSLPTFVLLVLLSPVAAAASLLNELRTDGVDVPDVLVPAAATMLTAVLLVVRLAQMTEVALRRAADLDARSEQLETALRQQAVLQRRLRHLALHDPLTGLANRVLVHRRIDDAVRDRTPGALLLFDLDGFKDVNDRYGHPVGDDLLIAVARRVQAIVEPAGMLGRLGGDEFAVLLTGATRERATAVGEALLTALRRPVEVHGRQLYASASVGLRLLDGASDTAGLVRDADLALYAAKAAGKDQLAVFDDRLRQAQLDQTRIVERLRTALDDDQFVVHYQPMVQLSDNRVVAVEALLRWCPPGAAQVEPDRFIPAAEASGLIVALGEWVLRRACADAVDWYHRYGTELSVNVSPRQLRELDFADMVIRALDDAGLPADMLTLEVTEGVLVGAGTHTERAVEHLRRLRRRGVRVALDDFGTGYSSLAYLRDLPLDTLKIDRSFLPAADCDTAQRMNLVRAIVDLAAGLDLTTVAEGVEDAQLVARLRDLGCHRAQGHHFARPVPRTDVPAAMTAAGNATTAIRAA